MCGAWRCSRSWGSAGASRADTCSVVTAWWSVLPCASTARKCFAAAVSDDARVLKLGVSGRRTARTPLPRWTVPVVALVALAAAVGAGWLLWWWITRLDFTDPAAKDRASAQLDTVKIAASIAVGGGGLFALYLAARRQRTQELELEARHVELAQRDRVQAHVEQDAVDRRVTELYSKAAEQLGSDKAPVRLAGLYALERLAQDNQFQRQTVAKLLCAYLRMPYSLPGAPPRDDANEHDHVEHRERTQEHEVRLAAQRVLADHLLAAPSFDVPNPGETFWADTDLDLTGATLIDLNLAECQIRDAYFGGARFVGSAMLGGVVITRRVRFGRARFESDANFVMAAFAGPASFDDVYFAGEAAFGMASFYKDASFRSAHFAGNTVFNMARFIGNASFDGTRFTDGGGLDGATVAHPVHGSSWPAGWHHGDEHVPFAGLKGTWHPLVRVPPEPDTPSALGV